MTKAGYIVHDLRDMAVARRASSLREAGVTVKLAGFVRRDAAGNDSPLPEGRSLGQTVDGKLGQRAFEVLRNIVAPTDLKAAFQDVDVLIARNLESLMIAARIADGRPLIYECLDIHRLLLSDGPAARLIQVIEGQLLSRCEMVIVSSPAFEREYFARKPNSPPVMLIENRVPEPLVTQKHSVMPDPVGPFTIAWFGMLRCRKSFEVLSRLCLKHEGKVRVLIAGKPSTAEFADFAAMAGDVPNMTFIGPYSPAELPDLYSQCHFAWTIDWFEEGLNSEWLLPNRLYEAASFGVVPIALSGVETGRWLKGRDAGLVVEDIASLDERLEALDSKRYVDLAESVRRIPKIHLINSSGSADRLAATLRSMVDGGPAIGRLAVVPK